MSHSSTPRRPTIHPRSVATAASAAVALALAACGGGNPLGNPPTVDNPRDVLGSKLSYVYFQKCVNPIFLAQLRINQGGVIYTNTCAAAGCHDTGTGTGGSFRVVGGAQPVDLSNPANTPDVVRLTDMYKNYVSAQGSVVIGSAPQSRLLTKPLLSGVLHGGGLIFDSTQDPNARVISYWINHPVAAGQDEFSAAANMFTPPDPNTGACNTQ